MLARSPIFRRNTILKFWISVAKICWWNCLFIAGIINTDLHRHMYKTWYGWLCWPIHQFFVKTPFYGAQTTLYCCLSDSISSGGYYSDCRKKSPSQRTSDDRACKKLWDVSEKMVGLRSSQSEMLWFSKFLQLHQIVSRIFFNSESTNCFRETEFDYLFLCTMNIKYKPIFNFVNSQCQNIRETIWWADHAQLPFLLFSYSSSIEFLLL